MKALREIGMLQNQLAKQDSRTQRCRNFFNSETFKRKGAASVRENQGLQSTDPRTERFGN